MKSLILLINGIKWLQTEQNKQYHPTFIDMNTIFRQQSIFINHSVYADEKEAI